MKTLMGGLRLGQEESALLPKNKDTTVIRICQRSTKEPDERTDGQAKLQQFGNKTKQYCIIIHTIIYYIHKFILI